MKPISIVLLITVTLFFPVITVEANDIIQILFDDDHADACNDDEWWQIDNAIYVLSQNQRALRGDTTEAPEDVPVDQTDRALWPNYCANQCAGYVARTCKALNCKGYRRRSMVESVVRGLFWATTCQNQISELNNLLNNMRNNNGFSDSCKWYLGLYREYNCFTDEYCGTDRTPAEEESSSDDNTWTDESTDDGW